MNYFQDEDLLHLVISDVKEASSVEFVPNVTAEVNEHGELIATEIPEPSILHWDSILEGAEAKMLDFAKQCGVRMEPTT